MSTPNLAYVPDALRVLSESATVGPWAVPVTNVFRVIAPEAIHTNGPAGAAPPYPWCVVANVGHESTGPADASFIVAAVNATRERLALAEDIESARVALVRDLVEVIELHTQRLLALYPEQDHAWARNVTVTNDLSLVLDGMGVEIP